MTHVDRAPVAITVTTAGAPGAVAIVELHGQGAGDVVRAIITRNDLPHGVVRFARLADVDEGLAVVLRDDWAQLMPHGGPRVVEKLIEALVARGCVYDNAIEATAMYPEASCPLEAHALHAISRAASPAAIDLLLRQTREWVDWLAAHPSPTDSDWARIAQHSARLDRLIDPPSVVVVGRPNVGKSTLTNRMLGRSASIVADLPGTTRDWVAGLAELHGVAVRWMDTPGLRHSDDAIEQQAIELAAGVVRDADVLIALRDHAIDWPALEALPREPDLWVINKADMEGAAGDDRAGTLAISAATGKGVDELEARVIDTLGLRDIKRDSSPWLFCDVLLELAATRDVVALRQLV